MRFLRVDPGLFDAYDAEILSGQAFEAGDLNEEATAVVVNRAFERQLFGDHGALGRRIRYVPSRWVEPEPWALGKWFEIVGIVGDFPAYASGSDGSVLAGGLFAGMGLPAEQATFLLLGAGAIVLAVGALAALGPARRGLRIEPTEALKEG